MILVEEKHFHRFISIYNSLSACNQEAKNKHKSYYVRLLIEGMKRIFPLYKSTTNAVHWPNDLSHQLGTHVMDLKESTH